MVNHLHDLGATFKKIRTSKKLTQSVVASASGVSQSNYSKYEQDKIEINSEALIRLTDVFDISFNELLYIHNGYRLTEKEQLLKRFFNCSFQDIQELTTLKADCEQFLQKQFRLSISEIKQFCEALIVIQETGSFEAARAIVRPIWQRFLKKNESYIANLYVLRAIVFILPADEANHILSYVKQAQEKYDVFPQIAQILVNVVFTVTSKFLQNDMYYEALEVLLQIEESYTKQHRYDQLALVYIRKGICLNALETAEGPFWIKKGMHLAEVLEQPLLTKVIKQELDQFPKIKQNV